MESTSLRTSYIFQMVFLAILSLGLQIGLPFLIADDWSSFFRPLIPTSRVPFGNPTVRAILPGCSAVWQGELWVAITPGSIASASRTRPTSAQLIAFDLKTGKRRETNLGLSASPTGFLVLNDELWAVSESTVSRIVPNVVDERHPRRALMQPTKPFIYNEKLAVVDKNNNDVFSLLTLNDFEWTEEGQVDVPNWINAQPWFTPELRVISEGNRLHAFVVNANSISYCEGILIHSDSGPVTALLPENSDSLSPKPNSGVTNLRRGAISSVPISAQSPWEIAFVNSEILAFTLPSPTNSSTIQIYKFQDGIGVTRPSQPSVDATGFSVASGSPGYLITDDFRLFKVQGSNLQQIVSGNEPSAADQFWLYSLVQLGLYLLSTAVLVLGTWKLMRNYRNPEYLFGKRTVIQASVLRRGLARGIDLAISLSPIVFWLSILVDAPKEFQTQSMLAVFVNPVLAVLFSVFGTWCGILLALSVMEGLWGITPGKFLCGIRTMRTTLRPCGIVRALARELLVYADGLFLATWLPGVLLIAFTPCWQRLGDLTADTVVIMDPGRVLFSTRSHE